MIDDDTYDKKYREESSGSRSKVTSSIPEANTTKNEPITITGKLNAQTVDVPIYTTS